MLINRGRSNGNLASSTPLERTAGEIKSPSTDHLNSGGQNVCKTSAKILKKSTSTGKVNDLILIKVGELVNISVRLYL